MRLIALAAAVACVALLVPGLAGADPILQLHKAKKQQAELLVPGPAGWSLIRDVRRYQQLERQAAGAWHVITWNPYWAIRYTFGSRWPAAWRVSLCEAGSPMPSPRAHNGQYLGLFQMGSSERHLYGHGASPLSQAQAAFRYSSGGRNWGPWACKP